MGEVIDIDRKRLKFDFGTQLLIAHMEGLWILTPDEFDRIIKNGIDYCRSKGSDDG